MILFTILSTILLCNALPLELQSNEPRSLFEDVIKSLKIRSQFSEDTGTGDENAVSQQYEEYQVDRGSSQLLVPTDIEYMPRRNDRIELPPLRHRLPKQAEGAETKGKEQELKENPQEIVILIDTHKSDLVASTSKPKRFTAPKRPRPTLAKEKVKIQSKNNETTDGGDIIVDQPENPEASTELQPAMPHRPQNNNMSGQSQIGNRESQMVIKPTVIVNLRGTVTNRDSDIKLEGRNNQENSSSRVTPPQNVFNIKQDIHIEKTYAIVEENRESTKSTVEVRSMATPKINYIGLLSKDAEELTANKRFGVHREARARKEQSIVTLDISVEDKDGNIIPFNIEFMS